MESKFISFFDIKMGQLQFLLVDCDWLIAAPNAYTLPTTVGDKLVDKKTLPSYSIRSRPEIGSFAEDLQRVSLLAHDIT